MQFGSAKLSELIFESTDRTRFELKWKNLYLNYWVTREVNWAGPRRIVRAGVGLSECPHQSVRQGCEGVRGNLDRAINI